MRTLLVCVLSFLLGPGLLRADSYPSSDLAPEDVIAAKPGLAIYNTKAKGSDDGKFAVWIPASYNPNNPMPLIVSAHGHTWNGEKEAKTWKGLPDKYKFILVCPSYFTSDFLTEQNVSDDNVMLKEVMTRVFGSLNIDRRKVLHTGFSGCSLATWYVAAEHDDWFTALCTRSGNFFGDPPIRMTHWRQRPIYIFWGQNDIPDIITQSTAMVDFVDKTLDNTKEKHEVIPGGHHEGHPDLVAKWFAGLTDDDYEPPDPDAPVHF
jgi:predicted peptidase